MSLDAQNAGGVDPIPDQVYEFLAELKPKNVSEEAWKYFESGFLGGYAFCKWGDDEDS